MFGGLLYVRAPAFAILALGFSIAMHSSLQHEVLHGHPTRSTKLNEAMTFFPMNFFYPFRRYKLLHLRHHADHRLTDPYEDPESYYRSRADWDGSPRWLKRLLSLNNTLAGRLAFGPGIALAAFVSFELNSTAQTRNRVLRDWALHLAGAVPTLLVVAVAFRMPLGVYVVAMYLAASLISIRSFCEHQWSETFTGRSIIVESRYLKFLFLNNNLHLVHHTHPAAAWYELPGLYHARRSEWSQMNGGYVFRGYIEIFKRYGLRAKEPVAHPGLRLADEGLRSWGPSQSTRLYRTPGSHAGAGLEPAAELAGQTNVV